MGESRMPTCARGTFARRPSGTKPTVCVSSTCTRWHTPSRYQRAGARERELDAKWTRSVGAAGEEGEETGCRSVGEGEQKPYMMVRPRTCMVAYRAGAREAGEGGSFDVGQGKNGIDGVKLR